MIPALRWAPMRAILMFEEQSHKTVSTNHNFFENKRAEAVSKRGPSAYQPVTSRRFGVAVRSFQAQFKHNAYMQLVCGCGYVTVCVVLIVVLFFFFSSFVCQECHCVAFFRTAYIRPLQYFSFTRSDCFNNNNNTYIFYSAIPR